MSDAQNPICPCDDHRVTPPTNPAGLPSIAFRYGAYREFRRALLTRRDGETALLGWRPGGAGDLGVMMVEWWAYLADILTFYNERIANQDYLRTADRPQSVNRLIKLLGYRPRPAIGATGTLAALVTPGQSATLPKGLQFKSKPGPGQQPQTFELDADTKIGAPDAVPARLVETLLAPDGAALWLPGQVKGFTVGEVLLLRAPDPAENVAATVAAVGTVVRSDKTRHTRLSCSFSGSPPSGVRAADMRLQRARQASGLWTFTGGAIESSSVLHLAGLARDLRPGDPVIVTGPASGTPLATRVTSAEEVVWYANHAADPSTAPTTPANVIPLAVLHARLTLADGVDSSWAAASISVAHNFGDVADLENQPADVFDGSETQLEATAPAKFLKGSALPVLVEDATGAGIEAEATSEGDGSATLVDLPTSVPDLSTPLKVFYDLLSVSRGKTVANEVLGSGDARIPGQVFTLAKSPVTYLTKGSTWASTIQLRVNGHPWKEVASFYGQAADAEIFVTRETEGGQTQVMFGDGANGARLPTGVNNVVATYRIGAGADAPPAGKLTQVATPWPGLAAVRNPVAVGGGADPDPPDQVRRYAPRSVLTFGRAVSVLDYEALAAQAPGVTRARAAWSWNDAAQRAAVTVYVGDDEAARKSAADVLKSASDPNRPVSVVAATPLATYLTLQLRIVPGMDEDPIKQAVVKALTGDGALFSPQGLRIGQPVFDSAIVAAVLSVDGVVAITQSAFFTGWGWWFWNDASAIHQIDEGSWFDLTGDRIVIAIDAGGG